LEPSVQVLFGGVDGWHCEEPTSTVQMPDDVESFAAAASILALFFGVLLAITHIQLWSSYGG